MKDQRQRAILDLVRDRPVHTQQELARALSAIGIQAADFDEWASDVDGPLAVTVSSSAVLTGLQRENPKGFSSVDLLV